MTRYTTSGNRHSHRVHPGYRYGSDPNVPLAREPEFTLSGYVKGTLALLFVVLVAWALIGAWS